MSIDRETVGGGGPRVYTRPGHGRPQIYRPPPREGAVVVIRENPRNIRFFTMPMSFVERPRPESLAD